MRLSSACVCNKACGAETTGADEEEKEDEPSHWQHIPGLRQLPVCLWTLSHSSGTKQVLIPIFTSWHKKGMSRQQGAVGHEHIREGATVEEYFDARRSFFFFPWASIMEQRRMTSARAKRGHSTILWELHLGKCAE